jgi:hypothetical protein
LFVPVLYAGVHQRLARRAARQTPGLHPGHLPQEG